MINGLDADAIDFIAAYCYGEYSTVSQETLFPKVAAAHHLQARCFLALVHVWLLCYSGAHSLRCTHACV